MDNFKKRTILLVLFIFSSAFLISSALSFQIEYYDSAVLRGLWLPSIVFVFSICTIFIFGEFGPRSLAILASIYLIVLNLIPSLKYKLIYNSADTMGHSMLTRVIYEIGFIPARGDVHFGYVDFPAFHILNVIVSLASGIQPSMIAKFITFVLWGLIPIVVFMISKQLGFNRTTQVFAIFASLLLYNNNKYYIASSMAFFLVLVVISLMLFRDKRHLNSYNILILILIIIVPFIHHYTSFMLTLYLVIAFISFTVFQSVINRKGSDIFPLAMFSLVLVFAWWMYQAHAIFTIFAMHVKDYLFGAEMEHLSISPFLTEVKYTPRELLLLILTSRPGTIITGIMSGVGLYLLFRNFRKYVPIEKTNQFLLVMSYVGMTLIFAVIYFFTPFKEISIERTIVLGFIVAPVFSGIALLKISTFVGGGKKIIHKKFALLLLFTLIFSITLIGYYPSENRPYGFPTNLANSIYQKQQAEFVQDYLPRGDTLVVAIEETNTQLMGFGGPEAYGYTLFISADWRDEIFLNFLGVQEMKSPIRGVSDKQLLVLLHYDGKAGHKYQMLRIKEKESGVELDQNRLIDEGVSRDGVDMIYDNGESFIATIFQ